MIAKEKMANTYVNESYFKALCQHTLPNDNPFSITNGIIYQLVNEFYSNTFSSAKGKKANEKIKQFVSDEYDLIVYKIYSENNKNIGPYVCCLTVDNVFKDYRNNCTRDIIMEICWIITHAFTSGLWLSAKEIDELIPNKYIYGRIRDKWNLLVKSFNIPEDIKNLFMINYDNKHNLYIEWKNIYFNNKNCDWNKYIKTKSVYEINTRYSVNDTSSSDNHAAPKVIVLPVGEHTNQHEKYNKSDAIDVPFVDVYVQHAEDKKSNNPQNEIQHPNSAQQDNAFLEKCKEDKQKSKTPLPDTSSKVKSQKKQVYSVDKSKVENTPINLQVDKPEKVDIDLSNLTKVSAVTLQPNPQPATTVTTQKLQPGVILFPGNRHHDDIVKEATKDTLIDPNDNCYKETVITNNFIIRKNMPEVSDFIQIANDCGYDVVCSYELFTSTNIGIKSPMATAYLINKRTKAVERCFIVNNTIFGRTCVYMVPVNPNVDVVERSINMFNIDKMPLTNITFQLSNWVDVQKHRDIVRCMIKSGKYSDKQKSIVLNKIPKIFRVVENDVGFDDRIDLTSLSQIPMMAIDSKYDQTLTNIGKCVFDRRVPMSRYHINSIENENNFSLTNIVNGTFSYIDNAINENVYINSINNPVTILYTNGEISMYDLNGNRLF